MRQTDYDEASAPAVLNYAGGERQELRPILLLIMAMPVGPVISQLTALLFSAASFFHVAPSIIRSNPSNLLLLALTLPMLALHVGIFTFAYMALHGRPVRPVRVCCLAVAIGAVVMMALTVATVLWSQSRSPASGSVLFEYAIRQAISGIASAVLPLTGYIVLGRYADAANR